MFPPHAIEKEYPGLVIMIMEHLMSELKPMHTLSLLKARTSYGPLWI